MDNAMLLESLAGKTSALGLFAPSPVYLTGEEQLRLTSVANAAGVTLTVGYRILLPNGSAVRATTFKHVPNSNRTASATTVALPEGWLLGLSIRASAGGPPSQAVWTIVELVRPDGATADALQAIVAGFPTTNSPLFWPGDSIEGPLDGAGCLRSITGTTPAAGADISETVPAAARWELLGFKATLTTGAAVATRVVALSFDDGAAIYTRFSAPVGQAASLVETYNWFPGGTLLNVFLGVDQTAGVPVNNRLGAGHRIRTSTALIQAADQWSAVQYLVREWFDV